MVRQLYRRELCDLKNPEEAAVVRKIAEAALLGVNEPPKSKPASKADKPEGKH